MSFIRACWSASDVVLVGDAKAVSIAPCHGQQSIHEFSRNLRRVVRVRSGTVLSTRYFTQMRFRKLRLTLSSCTFQQPVMSCPVPALTESANNLVDHAART